MTLTPGLVYLEGFHKKEVHSDQQNLSLTISPPCVPRQDQVLLAPDHLQISWV